MTLARFNDSCIYVVDGFIPERKDDGSVHFKCTYKEEVSEALNMSRIRYFDSLNAAIKGVILVRNDWDRYLEGKIRSSNFVGTTNKC